MTFLVQGAVTPDDSVSTVKVQNNAIDETKLKDALVADFTEVTVVAGDSILLGDASDSGNTKRDTVQGILDLAGGGITQNAIAGLTLSKSGADALTIAAGSARDTGDAATMTLAAFTKDVSASWAVGTGNGSLDTGSYATSKVYAVWLIQRSGTAVVDVLTSLSFTAPTMPTSYDRKRLIGYFLTDTGPDIIAFTQSGDYFRLTGAVVTDVDDTTVTAATFETATLSCPPSCLAHLYCLGYNPSGSENAGKLYIKTKDAAETANGSHPWIRVGTSGTFDSMTVQGFVLVNSSSQIEYALETVASGEQVSVYMFGCLMLTRSDP